MGKILNIRVSVNTYDDKDVVKAYPHLHALAWPKDDKNILASQTFGLLELIESLYQASQFAPWEEQIKNILKDDIKKIYLQKQELDKLILARQIKEADTLIYTIEESLQELEIKAKL